jgi:hypothetical protein
MNIGLACETESTLEGFGAAVPLKEKGVFIMLSLLY